VLTALSGQCTKCTDHRLLMDLIIGATDDRFNCSTGLSTVGRTLYIGRQYRVTLNAYRPCFSAERRYAPKSRNLTGFISPMLQAYQPYFATLLNRTSFSWVSGPNKAPTAFVTLRARPAGGFLLLILRLFPSRRSSSIGFR
jgi:hypothetical protein